MATATAEWEVTDFPAESEIGIRLGSGKAVTMPYREARKLVTRITKCTEGGTRNGARSSSKVATSAAKAAKPKGGKKGGKGC
jgi:hypothetical protein